MAWTAGIVWAFREVATSAKLQAMVDNILAHDHRSDGSRGAALVGDWTEPALSFSAGWAVSGTPRVRLLAGGTLAVYDIVATRTGANLDAADTTQINPGNYTDSEILTGIPAAYRPAKGQDLLVDREGTGIVSVAVSTAGTVSLSAGVPFGSVRTGQTIEIRGLVFLG